MYAKRKLLPAAILSCLVAGWLNGQPAAAQPKAPPTSAAAAKPSDVAARAEAERAGKEGERLLAAHDAGRAIEQLQRAHALSHNPKFLLPLGMAYAEAERPLDALDALGRFLKEVPALPEAKRKEIGGKLQVMLDQVAAVVTIEASRQNAGVKVDGRQIGTTPIETPLRLLPGKHEIVLQPAPTDPSSGARAIVDVKPGERRTVKLEPGPRSRFLEPQSQGEGPAAPDEGAGEPGRKARRAVAAHDDREQAQTLHIDVNPRQLHKKWWFWAGVGGATAILVVGLAAGLSSRGGGVDPEAAGKAPTWRGGVIDGTTGTTGMALALLRSFP